MGACQNLRVTINGPMLAKAAALSTGKPVWMMRNATVTTCTLNLNVVDTLILR
ncbi:MAG: hypothetical protein JSV65_11520 [Armatimonadota bacterium]|nr:MAG: hypothetical protein JSV65_11520 [Armatimonadota bacterium]